MIGYSGAGKSTILKIIAGLTDPDAGQVFVGEQLAQRASEKLIPGHPDVKLVHQEYNLFPHVSLRQNIEYILRFFETNYRTERTDELVELCQIAHVQHKVPRLVSGGERQRTAIACAIAEEPKVLLLDEPFSHLDLPNRKRLREVVVNMVQDAQMSCVFVTHDATDIMAVADRVGVLMGGQLAQVARPIDVFYGPLTRQIAELMGEINTMTWAQFEDLLANTDPILFADGGVGLRPNQVKYANLRHDYEIISTGFNGFCTETRIQSNGIDLVVYQ